MGVRVKTITNRLPQITKNLRGNIAAALNNGADRQTAQVKSTVHVVSGETRDSAETSKRATANDLRAESSVGGAILFEEFGTVRRPPHPTVLPAFETTSNETIQELKGVIK
jgi:HK97 gp10 family phage protein